MNASLDHVEQSGILTSIYRAIIVALAITVIGIYFIRTPLIAIVGQSEILLEAKKSLPDSSKLDASHQIYSLDYFIDIAIENSLSESALKPILEKSPEFSNSFDSPSHLNQQRELELLQHRIQIKHDHKEDEQIVIKVEFVANNTPLVLGISDQIAARFVQEIQSASQSAANQVSEDLAEKSQKARQTVNIARQNLDAFKEQYRDILALARSKENSPEPIKQSEISSIPVVEKTQSEKWLDLTAQLTDAEKELSDALATQTKAHPSVLNFQAKVNQIKSQLTRTPEFVEDGAAKIATIDSDLEIKTEQQILDYQAQIKEVLAKQLQLQNTLAQSEQQETDLAAYRTSASELQLYYQSISTSKPTNAKIAGTVGGLFPWHRLVLLLLGATVCGGIVSYSYPKAKSDVIQTLDELGSSLSVPLVGTLPSKQHDPKVLRATPWRDHGSQWATCISEYFLVSFTLILLVSVILVPNFTQSFIEKQFTALFDAQYKLWSLLG